MVQTHEDSHQEGMTAPIPHHETEKIWHGFSDPQKVLQLHHQEHHCLATARPPTAKHERVVRTAQYIITGAKLPAIQDLYTRRCQSKALKIVKHSSHRLFSLLPHGKRYRSAKSRSKRLLPPSNKTPEHLIKWLPRLFALFYAATTLCCYLFIVTLITLPTCTYYLD